MKITDNIEYTGEDFSSFDLYRADIIGCKFIECSFKNVRMEEVITKSCLFSKCDFTSTYMNASVHRNSAFTNCDFTYANLFTASFIDCKMVGSILSGASIPGLTIRGGDWSYAYLKECNLKGFDLRDIRFVKADLFKCNLENADLRGADMTQAILSHANLKGADLRGANIEGVDIKSLNMKKTKIDFKQAILIAEACGAVYGDN